MHFEEALICPVCGAPLRKEEQSLLCPARHTFDLSRRGTVQLLQGHAAAHGDNREMIEARSRFLEGGYYVPLREEMTRLAMNHLPPACRLLDAGCGEGYYTAALSAAFPAGEMLAFDVSAEAIRFAARRKCGFFFTASAYAIPVRSESIDGVFCLFAPLAAAEFHRVLRPGGKLFLAVPDRRHLWGLKQVLYPTPYENEVAKEPPAGFALLEDRAVAGTITLQTPQAIRDLFAMTPYAYRTPHAGREALAALQTLQTPIAFRAFCYKKQ